MPVSCPSPSLPPQQTPLTVMTTALFRGSLFSCGSSGSLLNLPPSNLSIPSNKPILQILCFGIWKCSFFQWFSSSTLSESVSLTSTRVRCAMGRQHHSPHSPKPQNSSLTRVPGLLTKMRIQPHSSNKEEFGTPCPFSLSISSLQTRVITSISFNLFSLPQWGDFILKAKEVGSIVLPASVALGLISVPEGSH